MRFGISTHLYHEQRLCRDHLAQIAAHGFEAVEVFATRSHFDYHDPAAIAELAGWLKETELALHGIHAPVTGRLSPGDQRGETISNAVGDNAKRQTAVREADAALNIARQIQADVFVLHLGTPAAKGGENNRAAAFRSVEEICRLAEPVGIRLDFGHAFLMGDVADTIEIVAEHLITTHVHDNSGKKDEHLVPFEGRINWDIALMTMQKVGYDGTYLMELANTGSAAAVLEQARAARARFEKLMAY